MEKTKAPDVGSIYFAFDRPFIISFPSFYISFFLFYWYIFSEMTMFTRFCS